MSPCLTRNLGSAMEGYRAADLVYEALDRAGEDLTTDGFISALESIDEYTDLFGYRVSFGPNKHGGATESKFWRR